MASLSVPATMAPFEHNTFHLAAPSISSHNRRKSRDPSATPLPAFTFNPGATSENTNTVEIENQDPQAETMAARGGHMRRTSKPPPLPEFKFNPGAEIATEDRPSPTHPVLEEMALNQQRMSRSARPAPLPQFTFAPGTSTHTSPSPTRSEFNESSQLKPVGGHKRAGSEFVGGGGTDGPTLVNTSPVKHESRPSGPPVSGSGRRGHAHRRSQAVSISDIDTSDLIKAHAVAKARTNSQPSTPSETMPNFLSSQQNSVARDSISAISPPASPRRRESAPGNRPRVEFAEKIDVIPRPLSMISSETEGSISTVRYGHSLNNSINSIASPSRMVSSLSSPMFEPKFPPPRPKTADPSTLLFARNPSPERPLSAIHLPKRPLSASGSPAMTNTENPPVKKKHFWFSHSPDRTPTPTPKYECSDPLANLPAFSRIPSTDNSRPKTSPERSTSSMRRKKYHTWTHSIFSKRTKVRGSKIKGKRTPTPPMLQRRPSDLVNQIFDADDTVVLRSVSPETKRNQPKVEIPSPSKTSASASHKASAEVTSPVLDLDAALGPFGSDERFGGEHSHKSAASRIAKLHSSERRGLVDAFGVAHRRTESAPSMPAFSRTSYSLSRHGSNPSLTEDVFDEEEEDIFLAGETNTEKKPQSKSNSTALKTADVTSDSVETKPIGGLGLSNVTEAKDAVLIVDSEENGANNDLGSSKTTLGATPIFSEADFTKRPMSSPMSFAYPSTQSHYASSTEGRTTTSASMISSPDPDHIQFENIPRFGPCFGEPSPEFYLRPSHDDLPSLSDSISSTALPRISSSENTRWSDENRDHRSASMFVPGSSKSSHNWKRSSLATLNRLIPGSANGSKLKFETTPDYASEHRSEKKAKRLSKLMTFWRSKEKTDD